MLTSNPYSLISQSIPSIFMQFFVLSMILLVIIGTVFDIIHKKNVKYFFENAKKAKKQAKRNLSNSERSSIVLKTVWNSIILDHFSCYDFLLFTK